MGGSQLYYSYFYAVDEFTHWGNTSHFTFFSEFNRPWKGMEYIEASSMTTLFVLSAIGNIFIIGFIFRNPPARTITNYFVCNLALADILFVTSGPFISYIRITETWRLGEEMCHFLTYEMSVCGFVMIWTMAAISIDRYVCINLKTTSRRLKPVHVALICCCIWVIAFAGFLPLAFFFHIKTVQFENNTICFCTVLLPRSSHFSFSLMFSSLLFLAGFVVPLIIITLNYVRIFKRMWNARRAVANTSNNVHVPSAAGMASMRRHATVVKTLVLLVVLFIIMWAPLFIVFGVIQFDNTPQYMNLSSHTLIWTVVIAYTNACVNPFLYGFINSKLRKGLLKCLICCGRRQRRTAWISSRVGMEEIHAMSYRPCITDN